MNAGKRPTVDLLITAVETNEHHGSGILLRRLFGTGGEMVCIRTASLYGGDEPFGFAHHELCSRNLTIDETEQALRRILELYAIRRILCVPYYREEFIHGLLAKEITGAPLCVYLMDDQNVFENKVPDHRVAALLSAADLRLGISPELCLAYQRKFQLPIDLMPPVPNPPLFRVPGYWDPEAGEPVRAAMLGNIWTSPGFERLRKLIREVGVTVEWYGKGPEASWLEGTPEEWELDGIRCMGFLPEEDLIAALASYPFVIVPSGSTGPDDDNPAFSRLSLPSRILFLLSRTDVPILLLGAEQSAAGRFINASGTGICSDFDASMLRRKIEEITLAQFRDSICGNIRRIAGRLSFPEGGDWIWSSLEAGCAQPAPFHAAFDATAKAPPWLESIPVAKPAIVRRLPDVDSPWQEEHAAAFAFLRTPHLNLFEKGGIPIPPLADLDIPAMAQAAIEFILPRIQPAGDVLYLGRPPDLPLVRGTDDLRIWHFKDIEAWQRAGYAGDPQMLRGPVPYPHSFPAFDGIVSGGWLGELPDDVHVKEGLALYLDACTRHGGFNLHFFHAVQHPTYFWEPPVPPYLRARYMHGMGDPDRDELLGTRDLFTVGPQVFDRNWWPRVRVGRTTFGNPIICSLFWRR